MPLFLIKGAVVSSDYPKFGAIAESAQMCCTDQTKYHVSVTNIKICI